ncbi:sigma factor [Paenibacillus sp. PL2-23]|uniref:sigma factor n=1 Tax=Paenibacillus sp. PL2-23 TaxID=2100729 RepID=UPI0030F95145
MAIFQQKIADLRACEPLVYTLCLKLLGDESEACDMAKRILVELFQDREFWMKTEGEREAYITRICVRHSLYHYRYGAREEEASVCVS